MNDNLTVVAGALAGALLGAAASHLLLTDRGRRMLRDVRPALDDLSRALQDVCITIDRLGEAVREGRRVTSEIRSAS